MADFNINHITGKQGQQGTVLAGITTVNSTGAMRIPSGPTEQRGGRGRGILGGSYPANTTLINKIEIASTGNATSFGLLGSGHSWSYPSASSTRGVIGGGSNPSAKQNVIDYVTIASTGNAADFGDLTQARMNVGSSDAHGGLG